MQVAAMVVVVVFLAEVVDVMVGAAMAAGEESMVGGAEVD